jgi:putative oxidoreductase
MSTKTELGPFARLTRDGPLCDAALLAARLLIAYLFVLEGWGKIGAYADVQGYMSQFGVEPRLLPLSIALEIGAGLALVVGFLTRPAAAALAAFSLLVAILFHRGDSYSETLELHKDCAIAGGLLALAVAGAGAWSLDALIMRRMSAQPGTEALPGAG